MDITTTSGWTVTPKAGWSGMSLNQALPLPALSPTSCLIKIHAVSLNYRDVAIPLGKYPMNMQESIIPCSDATATIVSTGAAVTQFKPGDRVCTAFNPVYQSGRMTSELRKWALGSVAPGTLRNYAVFEETALVHAPSHLSDEEASTLSCAAVTAWNVFFGMAGKELREGDWVLTQGTGGVSLIAIQIALAAGANVISTTSSEDKAAKLREMGVEHIINYKEDASWGETAKRLTPEGRGVDHVVEVGGDTTMGQSFKAIRMEGVISLVGFLGGSVEKRDWSITDTISTLAIIRGIAVGPRVQFQECAEFLARHNIKPFVGRVYPFLQGSQAFMDLGDKKLDHIFGKVVVRMDGPE